MNIVERLLALLRTKETSDEMEAPEGFCPNCWGREEYGGQFYKAVKNHGLDVNSKNPERGWIQDYADKHLSGIQLKPENEGYVCPQCKLTYQKD